MTYLKTSSHNLRLLRWLRRDMIRAVLFFLAPLCFSPPRSVFPRAALFFLAPLCFFSRRSVFPRAALFFSRAVLFLPAPLCFLSRRFVFLPHRSVFLVLCLYVFSSTPLFICPTVCPKIKREFYRNQNDGIHIHSFHQFIYK